MEHACIELEIWSQGTLWVGGGQLGAISSFSEEYKSNMYNIITSYVSNALFQTYAISKLPHFQCYRAGINETYTLVCVCVCACVCVCVCVFGCMLQKHGNLREWCAYKYKMVQNKSICCSHVLQPIRLGLVSLSSTVHVFSNQVILRVEIHSS